MSDELFHEVCLKRLKNSLVSKAFNITNLLHEIKILSSDEIASADIQEAASSCARYLFKCNAIQEILELREILHLSPNVLQQALFDAIKDGLGIDKIADALEHFSLSPEMLESEDMQELLIARIDSYLKHSNVDEIPKLIALLPLTPSSKQSAFLNGIDYCQVFAAGRAVKAYSYLSSHQTALLSDALGITKEDIQNEEIQRRLLFAIQSLLSASRIDEALEIQKKFNLPQDQLQDSALPILGQYLQDDAWKNAIIIAEKFSLPVEKTQQVFLESGTHLDLFSAYLLGELVNVNSGGGRRGNDATLFKAYKLFPFLKDDFKAVAINAIRHNSTDLERIIEIRESLPPELLDAEKMKEIIISRIENCFKIGDVDVALEYQKAFLLSDEGLRKLASDNMDGCFAEGKISSYFRIKEFFSIDKDSTATEQSSKELFKQIKGKDAWSDDQNISGPFEAGADQFGYKKMFEYLNHEGLTLHDGLHNFRKILRMSDASGLPADQFYAQILKQVMDDGASYEEGVAQKKLNSVANNINLDFDKVLKQVERYKDIKKMQDLAEIFQDTSVIFASWKNLKKYEELCALLGRTEILENLRGLRANGKEDLAQYVETLAFHPNVSMQEVLQFWRNPESFFETMDGHTPDTIQNQKKPSNYFNIPYLDLSARELRDALVEGAYDNIQSFPPYEVIYAIDPSRQSDKFVSLSDLIVKALGRRDGSVVGEAQNSKALFSKLAGLFKVRGVPFQDFMKSSQPEKDFPEVDGTFLKAVNDLLFDQSFGIGVKSDEYRVKISEKSDPDAVVAGNDTACCMPFGSGKNNVYTFNPACALLLVQKKNSDGVWRTVAQSVVTPDKDIKKPIPDLRAIVGSGDTHMSEVVDPDILLKNPSIMTFDNIEVAGNFKGNDAILTALYRDFSRRYIAKFELGSFDNNRAIVGMGYTDAMTSLPKISNTFFPETPIGYSDNLHEQSYQLDLDVRSGEENMIVGYNNPVAIYQNLTYHENITKHKNSL